MAFFNAIGFDEGWLFYYTKRLGGRLLDEYYGKEQNIFVKPCTIVLVSQTASGDNADYLVRVE